MVEDRTAIRRFAVVAGLVLASGCGGGPAPDVDFVELRDRYFVRTLRLNPVTATYLGGDEYSPDLRDSNGRLRDYSEGTLSQEVAFYRETQEVLRKIDISTLPPALRVDYKFMEAQLKFLVHELAERKYYQRAIDTYVSEPFRGMDWQLQGMQDAGGGLRGSEEEWKLVVARLDAIPRYLDVARANLLAGKQSGNLPDKRMVQVDGIQGSATNASYFRKSLPASAAGFIGGRAFGSSLLPQLTQSAERAAASCEAFATFLGETFEVNEKTDRFAAGSGEYEWRVHNVFGDSRSAAELYEYGAQQVALYDQRLKDVARQIDPRAATVLEVAKKLSDDAPKTDAEMYEWYREVATRAVAYGRERGMFDVPRAYKLDIVPTPQILVGTIEASYYPAPPFKKSGIGRFYLSPTGNDPGTLSTVVPLKEGNQRHVGLMVGGRNLDVESFPCEEAGLKAWISTASRLRDIAAKSNADVFLSVRGLYDQEKEKARVLKLRKPGDPNPYVNKDAIDRYFHVIGECFSAQLAWKTQ
jgi:uncharacterized protein (DUF885 family)